MVNNSIDEYVYVMVQKRVDDLAIVSYSKREEVENYRDLKHELVREAMDIVGVHRGIELHTWADIRSEGSGLGSS